MSYGSLRRPTHQRQTAPLRTTETRSSALRKLIALVFHYSLNGLLADEGTEYYRFCFELLDELGGASADDGTLSFLQTADTHIMGRTAYQGMAASLPAAPDHPWSGIMEEGRKVVFSRT